jgi:Fe-S oxidoreductase
MPAIGQVSRANTLRLALSGQLGPDAFTSEEMYRTMELCVSCKGCRRECPTGVDMAKMKVEFLGHYKKKHGLTLRDRLIAFLPRYAPLASRFSGVMNLRNVLPGMAALSEKFTGLSAKRSLPTWHGQPFRDAEVAANGKGAALAAAAGREVVLLVDTFNRYFEQLFELFP